MHRKAAGRIYVGVCAGCESARSENTGFEIVNPGCAFPVYWLFTPRTFIAMEYRDLLAVMNSVC